MHSSSRQSLPPIQVNVGGVASPTFTLSPSQSQPFSTSACLTDNEQASLVVCDGTGAGSTFSSCPSRPTKGAASLPKESTAELSSTSVTTELHATSATLSRMQPSSSTPSSDSLSWRKRAVPRAASPPQTDMMVNSNSFFAKKARGAPAPVAATTAGTDVEALRTHALTARRPPQPLMQRTVPAAGAAAGATAQPLKARPSRRRDSAEARARVLAVARHRRLLPLTSTAELEHEVEEDNAATPSMPLTKVSALRQSFSLLSELQVSVSSSPPALGSLLCKGSSRSFSQTAATLSSKLLVNAPVTEVCILEPEASTAAPVRDSSLHSSVSRLSSNASPASEGEFVSCSLTSLQQRLWNWTGGTSMCVSSTTGHGADVPESRQRQGRQAGSKTASLVSTTPVSPRAATSSDSAKVKDAATVAGHAALAEAAAQWKRVLHSERACGERGKRVAHLLIKRMLSTAAETGSLSGASGRVDYFSPNMCDDEVSSRGHLRPLCERAVVATYLLSSLVDSLPRHQQSLSPYIHMLIDFTFVSDAPANRAILGGSVQDEELLYALEMNQKNSGDDGDRETGASASGLPPTVTEYESTTELCNEACRGNRLPCLIDDDPCNAKDLHELLYPSFTRMTYVAAHYDAAQATVELAYNVRSLQLHHRNVPRLMECTHRHWMRFLIHAVLRAWRRLCHERKVQEQRQRVRWAERWTCEWVRIALRRWRGYGTLTLQIVEAESLAKALLAKKRADIERLENESASLQASCAVLQSHTQSQNEERDATESVIVQREQMYKKLLQQVREIDRVGSLMLRSLLLPDAPPVLDEADALNGPSAVMNVTSDVTHRSSSVISLNTSQANMSCSSASPSFSTASEELVIRHPPHTLVALPTLLQWAKACINTVQAEYVSFFPDDDDDDADVAVEGSSGDVTTSHQLEEASDVKQAKVRSRDESVASASLHLRDMQGIGTLDAASPKKSSVSCTTSTDKARNANKKEVTRGPLTGLEMLLNPAAAEVSASTTRSIEASDTVLVPMHMILLLMRGCCGAQEESTMASHDRHDALATTAETSVTINGAANALLTDNSSGATATALSWDLVRTIELADRVILDECRTLLHKAEPQAGIDGGGGSATVEGATHRERQSTGLEESRSLVSVSMSEASMMHRLSSTTQESLKKVCRVIVDTYEELTGTACIVTADQLFERSRGTLLVLIAALMHYYTSWPASHRQQLAPLSIKGKRAAPPTSTAAAHEGQKHKLNDEWSHPPHSHRRWLKQVQHQAQWIALSFSALHDAVHFAKGTVSARSIIEQERVARLLQHIALTEFVDLLCRSPDHVMQSYVDIIGVVERYAPSLHLIFHQYAAPLAQLCANGEGCRNATTQNGVAEDDADAYITGNTVWNLLCLTCLAGKAPCSSRVSSKGKASWASVNLVIPSPPFPATLHRPAVFSLIEYVAQGSVAPTGVQMQRRSMASSSCVAPSPPTGNIFSNPPDKAMLLQRAKLARAVSVSSKGRPIPCYARATRNDRHVDLRPDTGAVCVNYVQFVKLLIRLAHAWQCQQQQQPLRAGEKVPHRAETGEEGSEPSNRSLTVKRSSCRLSGTALSSRGSLLSLIVDSCGSSDLVHYEAIDYTSPLCPSYLDAFLGGLLLPRLLGANRWMGTVQRAFSSKPVLELLAQNHDALLTVFNTYQQPCECRGVRAALPPPFSTILASQVFAKTVDNELHSTSPAADGGKRPSHVEHSSFAHTPNDNSESGCTAPFPWTTVRKDSGELSVQLDFNQRKLPSTRSYHGSLSGTRDVGIVSVLRWKNVQDMAKDLEWHREVRLTDNGIRHCFDHVVADSAREGEVLFFAEFLQLLCAIAAYAAPDPTVALEAKLHSFLQTRVLTLLE
ncbi:hypothetical protein, conserved [Leishmania tarentolae]|uniref:Uncharacterized protein n=1 Tax=Leishmania tarentolae TaxID=5689 RepID=A0A640KJ38_LEITA|nr:hypothetical protein, conserved [Leishmania tarentolae]